MSFLKDTTVLTIYLMYILEKKNLKLTVIYTTSNNFKTGDTNDILDDNDNGDTMRTGIRMVSTTIGILFWMLKK